MASEAYNNALEIDESNNRRDDGAYGDPNDGFETFYSESFFSSDYSSESKSVFGNLDYIMSENLKLSLGFRWEDWQADCLSQRLRCLLEVCRLLEYL